MACLCVSQSVTHLKPCDWSTWFNGLILPCLALVETGVSSVNRFYSTDSEYSKGGDGCVQEGTIQVYRVVRSSDHGDLSRRNPFDNASLSNKETRDAKKELDEIDKKFDAAAELNANKINNNHEKSLQLMAF